MTDVEIRLAKLRDVSEIALILSQDTVGGHSDSSDPADLPLYVAAFERIAASPSDALYVAVSEHQVVGTFQTTLTTSMSGKGEASLTIRTVHTRSDMRGKGIGQMMLIHAIGQAWADGAAMVQLMSNAARPDAHRFYERLGFVASHVGFKMKLT
ncbi:GNAT family N-acetyltransferase [Hoeflea ulvae]|uniref:GNAT family N-acetyltransferase n=1 Tax=Hoeflea ulvae TaxID=2983764 RepID=A0ABT3YGB2_9HYPH|nr:GNAT family N-acetyltransferase [Hoeflea ulvae]MCY0094682.1 GNAT family N-acetyltransferase [Hoeflea ulvae]